MFSKWIAAVKNLFQCKPPRPDMTEVELYKQELAALRPRAKARQLLSS